MTKSKLRKKNIISKVLVLFLFLLILCSGIGITYLNIFKEDKVKIALIGDALNGEPFLEQAYNRLNELSSVYDYDWDYFPCERDVAKNSEHWEYMTREASRDNYDLIIGLSWSATDIFTKAIMDDTTSHYIVIDSISGNDSLMTISFNETEGAYILGAMVAKAFPNDKVFGYICSEETQATYRYRYGFEEGIKSVIPDGEVVYRYINSYTDYLSAYNATFELQSLGINFIMGGTTYVTNQGIFDAVLELEKLGTPVYTSGLDADQTSSSNPYILSGLNKDTGFCIDYIIKNYFSGNMSNGVLTLGLKDDSFNVVHIGDTKGEYLNSQILTPEIIEYCNNLEQDIINNKIFIIAPDEK